jgi:hypothetical protein
MTKKKKGKDHKRVKEKPWDNLLLSKRERRQDGSGQEGDNKNK